MGTNVTVSLKALLLAGVVVLALAVSYLVGDSRGTPAEAASGGGAAGSSAKRSVTVGGTGEVTAVPDQLGFSLEVRIIRPDLQDSLDESGAAMDRVLAELADHGVTEKDVRTTGLSTEPVYDRSRNAPTTLRGYRVVQRAQVLVPKLEDGGAAIAAAVRSGGTAVRVDGIALSVADPEALLAEAREAAVDEARAKAEEYAAAGGQELGEVLTLREVSPTYAGEEPWAEASLSRAYAADMALPIQAGEQELAVQVEVVWRLAD
ncbi:MULTISPECIES: SIMPL domain-containing protein [unclassified Nocardioides]|uniref:SIMPL domain-containing protein n=1 Tax=unclassified Nocardioides TaxID=2615069 RepID=UPI0030156AAD